MTEKEYLRTKIFIATKLVQLVTAMELNVEDPEIKQMTINLYNTRNRYTQKNLMKNYTPEHRRGEQKKLDTSR